MINGISIHAPTRGATIVKAGGADGKKYFNPRSHEGSDSIALLLPLQYLISIHAPTRGATFFSIQRDP